MSDRHKPSKLIKNQNTSTINADKLKAKMSETIISSAPPAFSSEYLGDELGSLSSCRSKYATTISRTPMNPARSNKWKFIVVATAIARRSESRVPAPHYNHRHNWFNTASTGGASDSNPLHGGRPFRPIGARDISCSQSRSVLCDVTVCVLIERAHRFRTGICLSDTHHENMIKLGTPIP